MKADIGTGLGVMGRASSLLARLGGGESFGLGDLALPAEGSGAHFNYGGVFRVECVDRNGITRWVDDIHNAITNQALDLILNQTLVNASGIATWYIGLVDNSGFSAFAAGDVPQTHSGWTESTAYSNSTRPAWTPGSSSGQSVTNASTVDFNMNATATIKGLFLISANDKGGGTSGQKLLATAAFSGGNQAVNNGDTLKVTYTVSASSS